ncbi:MAG: hypothetical protein Q4E07_00470 [Eubacteriales bacterium]|nr:hypothetical protein [Eubacteriales bacterium]
MKSKHKGLILLLLVIVASGVYGVFKNNQAPHVQIKGYIGGEKIGLIEDEQVKKILNKKYAMDFDYQKAGSYDMIRANHTEQDYLWPSSQTALDLYEKTYGKPKQNEIIFNTPIVIYSRKAVADSLINSGYVKQDNGIYYMDMAKFLPVLENSTKWRDIGVDLYDTVVVHTTNPSKSNSGNMFSGLLANMLAGGSVVTEQNMQSVIPKLKAITSRLGFTESSSSDLFSQFLKLGVGARPLVAGYESQLIEFANTNPQDYNQIKDDVVMIYPVPTVWSSHVFIALTDNGRRVIPAMMDEEIQQIAWEKHGFRTGVNTARANTDSLPVYGVAPVIKDIIQMPSSNVMLNIINALE